MESNNESKQKEATLKETATPLQKVNLVVGAYGTGPDCAGVVEWTRKFDKLGTPYGIKEGGLYTKYVGCTYLFKGYPRKGTVDIVGIPKKVVPASSKLISDSPMLKLFLGFLFLSRRKLLFKICDAFIDIIHSPVAEQLLSPEDYCDSVRELYRASEIVIKKIPRRICGKCWNRDYKMFKRITKIRDCACMSLEYDAAYKFPIQDAFSNLDKDELRKNPIKEIRRVFNIMIDRQIIIELADKWKKIVNILILLLKISPKTKKQVVSFLLEIDYNKIALDEDDKYFCLLRENYNYWGTKIDERKLLKKKIDKEKNHQIPKVMFMQEPPK